MAPEVIRGEYTEKVDMWGIGVVIYAMISGKVPFNGNSVKDLLMNIQSGKFSF
jgi:serine/threonine protein kinase